MGFIREIVYLINLDGYKSIGTQCIALYVNGYKVTYFDSFGVEYIPKKLKNSLEIKVSKQIFIE